MQAWGLTDTGNVRRMNQDAWQVLLLETGQLLAVVCDGMGGAKSGNIASTMTVDVFIRDVKKHVKAGMNRLELERHVDRVSEEMMHSYVERQAKGLRVSEQDKKLVCDLYRFGITDIFYAWLENGMKEDLETQIHRLSLLFTGNIRASLSRVQIPEEF